MKIDRVAKRHSSRKDAKNAKPDSLIPLIFFAGFAPLREKIRVFAKERKLTGQGMPAFPGRTRVDSTCR
jgi:hypothetical protein